MVAPQVAPSFPVTPMEASARQWSPTYRWIPIAGGFAAFALAFVTGANDVPTSFGASVGSGALTLRQSVALAFLMEVTGATLMGNCSIDALQSSILKERPDWGLLMWGFLIAMIAATMWLALATYMEMPVTSSLSMKGAIIGISLTTQGVHSIYWSKSDSSSPLHVGGVTAILLSWILAPLIAAAGAFGFFGFIKLMLLRSHQAEQRTLRALPFYYGVTVLVLIFFIIYRGSPRTNLHDMSPGKAALIAGSSAALAVILAFLIVVPLARKHLGCFNTGTDKKPEAQDATALDVQNEEKEESFQEKEITPEELLRQFNELRVLDTVYEGDEEEAGDQSPQVMVKCSPVCGPARLSLKQLLARTPNRFSFKRLKHPKKLTTKQKILKFFWRLRASTFDHKIEYDRRTLVRHALAEKFDEKVEELFSFLQILTACTAAFAHGSNDVASVMGPYAAVINIYKNHLTLQSSSVAPNWDADIWVFALGGIGVSIGYAVWGWKLVRCLGGRLAFLTPSRAFSAQICTVGTVLMASRTGFPVSSTHIFIGAVLGVSFADSIKNINWQLLIAFVIMWALTLLFTCGTTAALYAFTIFSPSVAVRQ